MLMMLMLLALDKILYLVARFATLRTWTLIWKACRRPDPHNPFHGILFLWSGHSDLPEWRRCHGVADHHFPQVLWPFINILTSRGLWFVAPKNVPVQQRAAVFLYLDVLIKLSIVNIAMMMTILSATVLLLVAACSSGIRFTKRPERWSVGNNHDTVFFRLTVGTSTATTTTRPFFYHAARPGCPRSYSVHDFCAANVYQELWPEEDPICWFTNYRPQATGAVGVPPADISDFAISKTIFLGQTSLDRRKNYSSNNKDWLTLFRRRRMSFLFLARVEKCARFSWRRRPPFFVQLWLALFSCSCGSLWSAGRREQGHHTSTVTATAPDEDEKATQLPGQHLQTLLVAQTLCDHWQMSTA
jgi:hypothetical protein